MIISWKSKLQHQLLLQLNEVWLLPHQFFLQFHRAIQTHEETKELPPFQEFHLLLWNPHFSQCLACFLKVVVSSEAYLQMSLILPYSFRIPIPTPMGTLPLTKDSRFPLIEFNSSFDSGIPFKRWGIWKESPKKHQENQRCNFISPHSESPPQKKWKSPGPPQTSPFKIRHHTVAAWVEFLESLDLVVVDLVVDLLENTRNWKIFRVTPTTFQMGM